MRLAAIGNQQRGEGLHIQVARQFRFVFNVHPLKAHLGVGLGQGVKQRPVVAAGAAPGGAQAGDEEVGARKMHAYLEYHIEQGPILEAHEKKIGVVTHCQGLWWLEFTLTGKEAHTGSTPMPKRRNASLGMARVIELVHEVAMDYQPDAVGAVGHIQVYPNSRNIIAGKAVFTIDIRSPNKDVLDEMDARIRAGIENTAEALDIGFEVEQVLAAIPASAESGLRVPDY